MTCLFQAASATALASEQGSCGFMPELIDFHLVVASCMSANRTTSITLLGGRGERFRGNDNKVQVIDNDMR